MRAFVILIILLIAYVHCSEHNIAEMFTNNSFFHEQFIHFIEEQDRQWSNDEVDLDFERNSDLLRDCAATERATLEHVNNLAIPDIAYYAEFGDLSFYCEHNITKLMQGNIENCNNSGYNLRMSSLDKYFRIFNPNLTIVPVSPKSTLVRQAEEFTEEMAKRNDSKLKWKLVVIMLGIKGHMIESQLELGPVMMQAVQRLLLYERTLVVIVRIADPTIWNNARHAHKACQMLLDDKNDDKSLSEQEDLIWKQIAAQINELQSKRPKLSGVEILSFNATLEVIQSTTSTDLTALGYDCYHFSSKGLSLFHTAIWNAMLTKDTLRSNQFRPHYQPPRCVDPQCPFIRTRNNSAQCNWNFPKAGNNGLRVEEWIAIGIFSTAVTLCAILLIALCCGRGRDQVITQTLKPVGADWSCITRFIDEDSLVLNHD